MTRILFLTSVALAVGAVHSVTSGSYTLIEMAKLYAVDPQASLADSLARIDTHEITKLDEPLPWRYAESLA